MPIRNARSPNEDDVKIGKRIRARRNEIKMTQSDLADLLKVSFQQLQKYEKGVNRVGGSRLFMLSNALQVPVAYFYEDSTVKRTGKSKAPEISILADMGASRDGIRMCKAFLSIKSTAIRNALADLAEEIAATAHEAARLQ